MKPQFFFVDLFLLGSLLGFIMNTDTFIFQSFDNFYSIPEKNEGGSEYEGA